MSPRASVSVAALSIAGALLHACNSYEADHACTLMGCPDEIMVRGTVDPSVRVVVGLCLNGVCGATQAVGPDEYEAVTGPLAFGVGRSATSGELYAQVAVEAQGIPPRDGDRLSITVRDADSKILITEQSWVLDYQATRINGPGCDPVCMQAELELGK